MENNLTSLKEIFKRIVIQHFIQIFFGSILYFYYFGYVCSFLLTSDSFIDALRILDNPDLKIIIFLAILGFLLLNCLVLFYLIIFEIFKSIYRFFKKLAKGRGEEYFLLFAIIILYVLVLLVPKMDFLLWAIFIVIAFSAINISEKLRKISSSAIFRYIEIIFVCLYLIAFPFIAVESSIIQGSFLEPKRLIYSELNVVSKIPLGIEGEVKTALGYANKLELLKIGGNTVEFFEPRERRLIILKLEDIIRIVGDPYPKERKRFKFELGFTFR